MHLSEFREAPYNPRKVSKRALKGLRESLLAFGDLSGFVVNRRTGNVICGHQRRAALETVNLEAVEWSEEYSVALGPPGERFESKERDGWATAPEGARYRVRAVDWDETFEKRANVAANNEETSGQWDKAKLADLLEELKRSDAASFEALRLDRLQETLGCFLRDEAARRLAEEISREPEQKEIRQSAESLAEEAAKRLARRLRQVGEPSPLEALFTALLPAGGEKGFAA